MDATLPMPLPLGGLFVIGVDDDERFLPSLWRERRAVVCFLRQLGCRFCRQQLAAMATIAPTLKAAGVALVFISLGSTAMARQFVARFGCPGELYVDSSTSGRVSVNIATGAAGASHTYANFRLLRGQSAVENESTAAVAQEAADVYGDTPSLSHEPGETRSRPRRPSGLDEHDAEASDGDSGEVNWAGDPFQVGGVFVLGPGNGCYYSFRSKYAGHHPALPDVLAAATGLQPDGAPLQYPSAKSWAERLDVLRALELPSKVILGAIPEAVKVDLDSSTARGQANRFMVAMLCVAAALLLIRLERVVHDDVFDSRALALVTTAIVLVAAIGFVHIRGRGCAISTTVTLHFVRIQLTI